MARPTSRAELKDYCLRKLGYPVVEINVDQDQLEDRIDDALFFFQEYHFDGVEKVYLKHKITAPTLTFVSLANLYTVGEEITSPNGGTGAVIDQNATTKTVRYKIVSGVFLDGEVVTGTTSTNQNTLAASSAVALNDIGNEYFPIATDILSVTRIFDVGSSGAASSLFNVNYQFRMNDLTTGSGGIGKGGLKNLTFLGSYMELLNDVLVGSIAIRFNRHTDRLHVDWDWKTDAVMDQYIIVEAYQVLNTTTFPSVWGDDFLIRYTTTLFKEQWGNNLSKFEGVQLPGGVTLNGRAILDDAKTEKEKIEEEMSLKYELPPEGFVG